VFGLHTSWPETKLQSVGSDSGPDLLNVVVDGNPVDLVESSPILAVSKRLTDTAGQTSHVELVSRPRQCRHSITSGILNIFLFRLNLVRVYQTLVLSILLYASETWTSLASDMKDIESIHMKCQRRILGIRWRDFVRNPEVYLHTGFAPVSDRITRGRNAIFGHVTRLSDNIPAHQAILRQVELSVGRPPDPTWKRPSGRPRTKWTNQLRSDNNNVPIATLWRQAIGRGHSRATLRSEPTTR